MRPLRVPIPVSPRPMRRKPRPIQSANPTHPAVLAEGQRNPPQRRPQIAGPQGSKPHSTPIGAASAANASGLVQTPQSKVPRPKLPAVHEANAPGHFRLSHSVYVTSAKRKYAGLIRGESLQIGPRWLHGERLKGHPVWSRVDGIHFTGS